MPARQRCYTTPRWLALRDQVRERAGCAPGTRVGRCEGCGLTYPLAVHHVKPMAEGGEEYPPLDGLKALCRDCHRFEHRGRGLGEAGADWDRLLQGR